MYLLAPGVIAGLEKVVLAGLSELTSRKEAVTCILLEDRRCPEYVSAFRQRLDGLGLTAEVIQTSGRFDLGAVWALRRRLKSLKPGIVHAHGYKGTIYGYLSRIGLPMPMIATNHGNTAHSLMVRIYEWLELKIFQRLSAVVAVSRVQRDEMVARGLAAAKVHVVENMLVIPMPEVLKVKEVKPRLALVAIGRLSPEKGLEDLFHSLASIREQIDVRLTLVGEGPSRPSLEALADALGLRERIVFAGYQVEVRPYLESADALVAPSHREGLPLNLIEAAVFGTCIIASRVGVNDTIVREGETGLLTPPHDPKALAEAILAFHAQKAAHLELARRAAPDFKQRFSPQAWALKTLGLYGGLVHG